MYEFFLASRYLRAKRKQTFISVISIISILGVMVGVMALIVVLSVMNGFRADLLSKILGVNSHLLVLNARGTFEGYEALQEKISDIDGVVATTPFLYSQVMVNSTNGSAGAVLRGISAESVNRVIGFDKMVKKGSSQGLHGREGQHHGIILGTELARQLGVEPGEEVAVVSPEGRLTPAGRAPNSMRFRVVGIFDSGMYEYDASLVFVALPMAQELLGMGDRVTGLEVRVQDVDTSEKVGRAIQERLGFPYWTKDWKMMNRSLFAALKLEKLTMFVILTMIILVGVLNIISTLVMVVMEKTKEIAILRAMGATSGSVMGIFMIQGLLIGLSGTVSGLGIGLGLCHLLAKYQFIDLPSDIYYISKLPVLVETWDVITVSLAAILLSFLATFYPSRYASRLNPVEAIRYE